MHNSKNDDPNKIKDCVSFIQYTSAHEFVIGHVLLEAPFPWIITLPWIIAKKSISKFVLICRKIKERLN